MGACKSKMIIGVGNPEKLFRFSKNLLKANQMMQIRHYALIFMILAIIANNIYAQTTFVIKFSHISKPDSPKGMAVAHFKEQAEKITKGRVRIDIYPDGQLYNENDALEALQLGAVQMMAPALSKFSTLGLHQFELFDLPYLFPNKKALYRVTEGPIGHNLLNALETKGIVGLGFWDNGFKSMFTNKPVHLPADMQGLKMRIQPSTVLATQMQKLGAIPFALTFSEGIDLFLKHAIDGTENTPSNFVLPHYVGIPKFLTLTNHGYLGYAVIINKKFWNELPPEIRLQLHSAMNITTRYANLIAQQQNERDLTTLKKSGKVTVYELTNAEKTLWRNALLPIQKNLEPRIGKELITAVNQTIAEAQK